MHLFFIYSYSRSRLATIAISFSNSILDDYTYNKQQKMKNDHPGSDGYILLDDDLLDLF